MLSILCIVVSCLQSKSFSVLCFTVCRDSSTRLWEHCVVSCHLHSHKSYVVLMISLKKRVHAYVTSFFQVKCTNTAAEFYRQKGLI